MENNLVISEKVNESLTTGNITEAELQNFLFKMPYNIDEGETIEILEIVFELRDRFSIRQADNEFLGNIARVLRYCNIEQLDSLSQFDFERLIGAAEYELQRVCNEVFEDAEKILIEEQ